MKNLHYSHCIIGIAFAAVLLALLGVSASTLGVFAIVLACPLMMLVMMRMMMGNHSGSGDRSSPLDDDREPEHDRQR